MASKACLRFTREFCLHQDANSHRTLTLAFRNAQFQVTLASWDVAQSYPYKGDLPYDEDDLNIRDDGSASAREGVSNRTLGPEWTWDVGASGSVEVHL